MRDNVLTMVALSLKSFGLSRGMIKSSLEAVFTHGCHCGWQYGRFSLSDKSLPPRDQLDKICLDFEHCSECAKMDNCDLEADTSSPLKNGTTFECNHLPDNSCQVKLFFWKGRRLYKSRKWTLKFQVWKLSEKYVPLLNKYGGEGDWIDPRFQLWKVDFHRIHGRVRGWGEPVN